MIIEPKVNSEQIYHHSRSLEYRSPFGAVSTGTYVDLAIDVHIPCEEVRLCYSYGLYSFSYSELLMEPLLDTPGRYRARIRMPGEPSLFFYWFRIQKTASQTTEKSSDSEMSSKQDLPRSEQISIFSSVKHADIYYVLSRHKADGTGRISEVPSKIGVHEDRYPAAFQITVFRKNFHTPDWFKGALIYQIFPDRFARGKGYMRGQMEAAKKADERIYHDDWYEDVDIHGKPQTGYLACDFYGGTLDGIAEKASYLESLHIDCLYLNPIFEARSNHRYDTADYMSADPMLGGNDAFTRFCSQMKKSNIAFLLDGVFSHTGADSRYFNKLGRYDERGAYQTAEGKGSSEYSSWYTFFRDNSGNVAYDSWWGFADLPNVNENDLSYRDYILGNDGVIESWLKKGASGFRLDVSDELPDSFLRELRSVVKESTDHDGVVLGEVWEDASNKISYGSYRDFLLGNTHDSVMGYTFRDTLLGFLTGAFAAQNLNARLESYRENYPAEAYYCIMNAISTHDVPRAITVVAGSPDPGDREKQSQISLDEAGLEKGMSLTRIALVIQMGYIGSPCIYYGDEIGMQGYRDPFNRRTYPWDRVSDVQKEQLAFYQNITGLRRRYPVLRTGNYRTLYAQDDVFVFERSLDNDKKDYFGKKCEGARRVVFAINRSENKLFSFSLKEAAGIVEMFFSHDIIEENFNGEASSRCEASSNSEASSSSEASSISEESSSSEDCSNCERLIGNGETCRTTIRPLSFQILVYM